MNRRQYVPVVLFLCGLPAVAQQPPNAAPPMPMSFFVTSAGSGKGADLGGLAGADQRCQTLATAAGSTKTWHAYMSTQAKGRQAGVDARERIGEGPWLQAHRQH